MDNTQFWIDHFSETSDELSQKFIELNANSLREILPEYKLGTEEIHSYESAENRVFKVGDTVFKFYRPGRWTLEAIRQEVLFLNDLREENISAVRPIDNVKSWNGIHYVAYESINIPFNETPEILSEESVKKLSHLMAKIHNVGIKREADERPQFDAESMTTGCFHVIDKAGFLPKDLYKRYDGILSVIVNKLDQYKDVPNQRIHGDAYSGNVVWKSDNPIFLDFDDFQVGPKAMDLRLLSFPWRLDTLSEKMDRKERREIQHQMVLDYYREVSDFPNEWEGMFPLMSAYRNIQFDAWFSSRWSLPGFAENYEDDDITKPEWWSENIDALEGLLS